MSHRTVSRWDRAYLKAYWGIQDLAGALKRPGVKRQELNRHMGKVASAVSELKKLVQK